MQKVRAKRTDFLIISIILIGFSGINEALAQDKFSLGISAQIHNTRLVINAINLQTKGIYRPSSSIFVEYEFGKKMAVHAGLGHSMMTQNSDAFKNNYHYIAIPLYLKLGRFKEGKKLAFSSFYGTNLHYLTGAQHIYQDGSARDIMDQSRRFHVDIVLGAGLKYKLSEMLTIEVLNSLAIGSNINNFIPTYLNINNLNTGWMLNFSYKF